MVSLQGLEGLGLRVQGLGIETPRNAKSPEATERLNPNLAYA